MRIRPLAISFVVYVAAIVLANYFIVHGLPGATPTGFGTYTIPVGFGLVAPAGVFMAAIAFPARDVVQRFGGRWMGVAAILIGAGLSYWISSPVIAVASGATFLCSETLDFAVYTPLQRDHFVSAVVLSGLMASLLDSWLFLTLAGLPLAEFSGLALGKVWVIVVAGPAAYGLRKMVPAT